jgi:hypothetical protein
MNTKEELEKRVKETEKRLKEAEEETKRAHDKVKARERELEVFPTHVGMNRIAKLFCCGLYRKAFIMSSKAGSQTLAPRAMVSGL